MTREQVAFLLGHMKNHFWNAFPSTDLKQTEAIIESWAVMLVEYDADLIFASYDLLVKTQNSQFPPSIGQIICKANEMLQPDLLTEDDAWILVNKAIRNGIYGYREEYNKLPNIVQIVVGSPVQLHEWALMDSSEVQSYIANSFKKSYKARLKERTEAQALPENVKEKIRLLQTNLDRNIVGCLT